MPCIWGARITCLCSHCTLAPFCSGCLTACVTWRREASQSRPRPAHPVQWRSCTKACPLRAAPAQTLPCHQSQEHPAHPDQRQSWSKACPLRAAPARTPPPHRPGGAAVSAAFQGLQQNPDLMESDGDESAATWEAMMTSLSEDTGAAAPAACPASPPQAASPRSCTGECAFYGLHP